MSVSHTSTTSMVDGVGEWVHQVSSPMMMRRGRSFVILIYKRRCVVVSAIIQSIIQRKAGNASAQHEQSAGPTLGHTQCEGGLRGHSVGDTWPYRVVGKGDGSWEVHRNGVGCLLGGLTIYEAHDCARTLATGQPWHWDDAAKRHDAAVALKHGVCQELPPFIWQKPTPY